MFKNIFDKFSSKKESDPSGLPEKRRVPEFAKDIVTSDEKWITSQVFVFVDKQHDNDRIYCAAKLDGGPVLKTWEIYSVSYNNEKKSPVSEILLGRSSTVEEALKAVANVEKVMRANDKNFFPVQHLKGNYREVANLHGAHFDENDNYMRVEKDTVVLQDAWFTRKSLDDLYGDKKPAAAEPVIATWDDFYREIVSKPKLESSTPPAMQQADAAHERESIAYWLKTFQKNVMDDGLSLNEKRAGLSYLKYRDMFCSKSYKDAGNVVALTGMLRAGGKLYESFINSFPASSETVQLIADIGDMASSFSQAKFGLTPEQGKQLANLITQGPDPYAGKPLPLEEWLNSHQLPDTHPEFDLPKSKKPRGPRFSP